MKCLVFAGAFACFFGFVAEAREMVAMDYRTWRAACGKLPTNRELQKDKISHAPLEKLPIKDYAEIDRVIDAFASVAKKDLGESSRWLGEGPDDGFFDPTKSWFTKEKSDKVGFRPFAQKLILPDDAVVIVQGDLHGDVISLLKVMDALERRKILSGFRVISPRHHLVFTGDYTDRGAYGAEVIYTLLRLKVASPENVHLVRGNHEDYHIVGRYGFTDELEHKYGKRDFTKLYRFYDLLPIVLYAGTATDVAQLNHGGMEPGYSPQELLEFGEKHAYQMIGEIRRKDFDDKHLGWLGNDPEVRERAGKILTNFNPSNPTSPQVLGFMWSDFSLFQDDPLLMEGRGVTLSEKPVQFLLKEGSAEKVRIRGVIRGHQHAGGLNPIMRRLVACDGAFRHWQEETGEDANAPVEVLAKKLETKSNRNFPDGSVWTLNVSPDSGYGTGCGYGFATTGVLSLHRDFAKWRMGVLKTEVSPHD